MLWHWALMYQLVAVATGAWLKNSMAPGARAMAARNQAFAAGTVLGLIGMSVIWPLTLPVLAVMNLRARQGENQILEEVVELEKLDASGYDFGDDDAPMVSAPDRACSACGGHVPELCAFLTTSRGGCENPGFFYRFCDECFALLAAPLDQPKCFCEKCNGAPCPPPERQAAP